MYKLTTRTYYSYNNRQCSKSNVQRQTGAKPQQDHGVKLRTRHVQEQQIKKSHQKYSLSYKNCNISIDNYWKNFLPCACGAADAAKRPFLWDKALDLKPESALNIKNITKSILKCNQVDTTQEREQRLKDVEGFGAKESRQEIITLRLITKMEDQKPGIQRWRQNEIWYKMAKYFKMATELLSQTFQHIIALLISPLVPRRERK